MRRARHTGPLHRKGTDVAGVIWRETLEGLLSFTERDFNQALLEARRSGACGARGISARLTLEIDDIERFVDDWPRRARVTEGVLDCPALRGELPIHWGVFELLGPSSALRDHLHLRMRYRLNLDNPYGGQRLAVRGFKVVENDPGYDSWSDTSTLFVRIYRGWWDPDWEPLPYPVGPAPDVDPPPAARAELEHALAEYEYRADVSEVAAAEFEDEPREPEDAPAAGARRPLAEAAPAHEGEPFLGTEQLEDDDALIARDERLEATAVMKISVAGFARELLTFTGTARSRWLRCADVLRYGRCFAEGLLKAYWGAPVGDGCASFPRDYQREVVERGPEPVPGRDRAELLPALRGGEPGVRYALTRTVVPFWVEDLAFPLNLHHITAAHADPSPQAPGSRGPVLLVHGAGVRA
jgi:hypothetical protein